MTLDRSGSLFGDRRDLVAQDAAQGSSVHPICTRPRTGPLSQRENVGSGPLTSAFVWCPRQDSNLRHRLRRAVLYPLSYGGSGTEEVTSRRTATRRRPPGRE
jgi:hypothetical protein